MQQAPSLSPEHVRFGHPDWVDSLARGAALAWWGLILGAAAVVARELLPHHVLVQHAGPLGMAAGSACLFYGAWLLTVPDSNGSTPASDTPTRWLLRATLAAAVAAPLLQWAAAFGIGGSFAVGVTYASALLAEAVDVAGRLTLFHHLGRIALRVPDPALAKRLVNLVPAYGLALVGAAGVDALRSLPVLRYLGLPAAIGLAVVTAVILRHVGRLGRALVIQTDYARGIWARTRAVMPGLSSRAA